MISHFRDKDTSYDTFTSMLEPLQSLADDLVENSQEKRYAISTLCLMVDVNPERMESFLDYIQFLKEGGFVLNRISDDGELPLLHNMCTIMLMNRTSIKRKEFVLRMTLELGGDTSALDSSGLRPYLSSCAFKVICQRNFKIRSERVLVG